MTAKQRLFTLPNNGCFITIQLSFSHGTVYGHTDITDDTDYFHTWQLLSHRNSHLTRREYGHTDITDDTDNIFVECGMISVLSVFEKNNSQILDSLEFFGSFDVV